MGKIPLINVIDYILKSRECIDISIHGNSMAPTLVDGDIVTIVKSNNYRVGDILIFKYKNEGLLSHRLLYINNTYVCKGDNSFRFESVEKSNIVGKIAARNGCDLERWSSWKTSFSKKIGDIFRYKKTIDATKKTYEYMLYSLIVLKSQEYKIVKLMNCNSSIINTKTSINICSKFTRYELENIFNKLNSTFRSNELLKIISQISKDDICDIDELCLYVMIDFIKFDLVKII